MPIERFSAAFWQWMLSFHANNIQQILAHENVVVLACFLEHIAGVLSTCCYHSMGLFLIRCTTDFVFQLAQKSMKFYAISQASQSGTFSRLQPHAEAFAPL